MGPDLACGMQDARASLCGLEPGSVLTKIFAMCPTERIRERCRLTMVLAFGLPFPVAPNLKAQDGQTERGSLETLSGFRLKGLQVFCLRISSCCFWEGWEIAMDSGFYPISTRSTA